MRGGSVIIRWAAQLKKQQQQQRRSYSIDPSRLLEGKVALITGASGGFGSATARLFARNGARLLLVDVQDEQGRALEAELGGGKHARYIHCDVSNEQQVSDAVNKAVSSFGRLDVMFNNAGVSTVNKGSTSVNARSISEIDLPDFEKVCSVNLTGVFLGVKHAARVMIPQRCGSIINTASITAIQCFGGSHPYSISKHGVVGVTNSAASELAKHGVRVNCISPWVIGTSLTKDLMVETLRVPRDELDQLISRNSQLHGVALGVDDVAEGALFLASARSKFISGHNLVIDGGYTITRTFDIFKN